MKAAVEVCGFTLTKLLGLLKETNSCPFGLYSKSCSSTVIKLAGRTITMQCWLSWYWKNDADEVYGHFQIGVLAQAQKYRSWYCCRFTTQGYDLCCEMTTFALTICFLTSFFAFHIFKMLRNWRRFDHIVLNPVKLIMWLEPVLLLKWALRAQWCRGKVKLHTKEQHVSLTQIIDFHAGSSPLYTSKDELYVWRRCLARWCRGNHNHLHVHFHNQSHRYEHIYIYIYIFVYMYMYLYVYVRWHIVFNVYAIFM